jgi:hypothetical protein
VQHLENVLTSEEIQIFKNYWNEHNSQSYINAFATVNHPSKERADHIDRRLLIVPDSEPYNILKRLVEQYFPVDTYFWANYQRQSMGHQLHVDEYGKNRQEPTWTIILALDTEPKFKAIIFKDLCNSCDEMYQMLFDRQKNSQKVSNITKVEDLEHNIPELCDYMELDGIFEYKAGCGVLFDTNQVHCSSHWTKYPEFKYRDLVQLHIGISSKDSYEEDIQSERGETIPNYHI